MFASIASCSACVFAPLMLSICSLFFHCICRQAHVAARGLVGMPPAATRGRFEGRRRRSGFGFAALKSLGIMRLRKGSSIWAGMARTKWNDGSARTPWLRISLSAAGLLSPMTCA